MLFVVSARLATRSLLSIPFLNIHRNLLALWGCRFLIRFPHSCPFRRALPGSLDEKFSPIPRSTSRTSMKLSWSVVHSYSPSISPYRHTCFRPFQRQGAKQELVLGACVKISITIPILQNLRPYVYAIDIITWLYQISEWNSRNWARRYKVKFVVNNAEGSRQVVTNYGRYGQKSRSICWPLTVKFDSQWLCWPSRDRHIIVCIKLWRGL